MTTHHTHSCQLHTHAAHMPCTSHGHTRILVLLSRLNSLAAPHPLSHECRVYYYMRRRAASRATCACACVAYLRVRRAAKCPPPNAGNVSSVGGVTHLGVGIAAEQGDDGRVALGLGEAQRGVGVLILEILLDAALEEPRHHLLEALGGGEV